VAETQETNTLLAHRGDLVHIQLKVINKRSRS